MRRLFVLSTLATFGLVTAEPVEAQYSYPPGYGSRGGVIAIDPDDDLDPRLPPPGFAVRRPSDPAINSQPLPPLQQGSVPYDASSRSAAPVDLLPPPPDRGYAGHNPAYDPSRGDPRDPRTDLYGPPPGVYVPPPPATVYGAPPLPNGQPPAVYAPPPAGDPRFGVPRPPMSIEAGRQPAYPGTTIPGTTGSIPPATIAALPPEDQPEIGKPKELPPQFRRQVVDYKTKEPAGTVVIDTAATFLYYVNGDGTAIRYGIGVGREGFTWSGTERISRMAEWPDWHPPAEMIERQPYLPRFMAGGESNPMGARALYLGKTLYRVHGTNQPSTIGQFVSSGCIRMLNEDVMDLYSRVKVGTKVVVIGDGKGRPTGPTAAR